LTAPSFLFVLLFRELKKGGGGGGEGCNVREPEQQPNTMGEESEGFCCRGNRPMAGMSPCASVMMTGAIFSRVVSHITS